MKAGHTTPKQEKFCQKFIECGNASDAYRHAYDVGEHTKLATVNRRATELMANGTITARIAKLREGHRERHEVTVDSLTKEYEEARSIAKDSNQSAAMVSATTGKAKLHGLLTEERKNARDPYGDMVDDEIDRRIAELKSGQDRVAQVVGRKAPAPSTGKLH